MIVYRKKHYYVEKDEECDGFVLVNELGNYDNHGHLKTLDICRKLIRMMIEEEVPNNDFFKRTVLRVSTNQRYISKVKNSLK